MPKRRNIRQLCEDRYDDPEVIDAVIDSATKAETIARIEAGELTLPGDQDALHFHRRLTGQEAFSQDTTEQMKRIKRLEEMYAAFNAANPPGTNKEYVSQLEQRIRDLEAK